MASSESIRQKGECKGLKNGNFGVQEAKKSKIV